MTPESAARLLDLLAARTGLVCAVGAGGKKSTLYRLAEAHLVAGTRRIGLTCTVSMGPPPRSLPDERLIAAPETLAAEVPGLARRHRLLALCPTLREARPARRPAGRADRAAPCRGRFRGHAGQGRWGADALAEGAA